MERARPPRRVAPAALAAAWLACGTVVAQDAKTPQSGSNQPTIQELIDKLEQQSQEIERQRRQLAEQERKLQEYRATLERALAEQRMRLQELEAQRGTGVKGIAGATVEGAAAQAGPEAASAQTAADAAGGTGAPAPAGSESLPAPPSAAPGNDAKVAQAQQEQPETAAPPAKPAGQAPQSAYRPPEIAQITEYPGVLTPKGKWVLEPMLEFSHSSNSRAVIGGFTIAPAIAIGVIDINNVNRDFWAAALTARYGLTNRMEVEARVPYVYRQESTTARPLITPANLDEVFNADGSGLGDIELTARYQLNRGGPNMPFFVGSLRFKTTTGTGPFDVPTVSPVPGVFVRTKLPTGTGFYALQPAITALYASDPVVFFGGASFIWNIGRDINTIVPSTGEPVGYYKPGNGASLNFGMGVSLNERASFSVGYEHTVFQADTQNGQKIINGQTAQLGTLLIGYSYRLSKSTTINLSLGAGLTDQTPDVTIALRLPVMF